MVRLMAGFVMGWVTGVVTLLALSAMSVHLAHPSSPLAGESDVRLQIHIRYLNDVVQRHLQAKPQVVVGEIKTVGLQLGLEPQAGMVLTPTFDVAGFFQLSPSVGNQLTLDRGKLAMHMLGEPRLGDLPIPIEFLPFDLAGEVRKAVDTITNNVLLAELNDNLRAGFGSDEFNVIEVQTQGDYLIVKLERK
ncbi:MAG TPA: hypothetical protein VM536_13255 [Chloroflexia bacterium]|nr:hypothetical protein [Chloroflexia bacterium]